ncbi:MAG TPA: hypothetical protein VLI92_02825 [Candidatus Saccharimonadales bacterium]|nr:hypothetical protein [Candidatus Saccharimonadales bacterium]
MQYIIVLALFAISYIIFEKILKSLLKGCLSALGIALLAALILIFWESTKKPVNVLNMFTVDNFRIEKTR